MIYNRQVYGHVDFREVSALRGIRQSDLTESDRVGGMSLGRGSSLRR